MGPDVHGATEPPGATLAVLFGDDARAVISPDVPVVAPVVSGGF